MKKIKNLLVILLLFFGFVSCKPSTNVSSSVPTTPISQTSSEMSHKVSLSHLKCSVPNEIKRKQQFRANSLDYQYLVVDINNELVVRKTIPETQHKIILSQDKITKSHHLTEIK